MDASNGNNEMSEDIEFVDDESGSEDGEEDMDADQSKRTYLPGQMMGDDEELVFDESTYVMYHQAQTGEYGRTKAKCWSQFSYFPK